MKNFLDRIRNKIYLFMRGRYGSDELSNFLLGLALIIIILNIFMPSRFLYILSGLFLFYNLFRMFSKNIQSRSRERLGYLGIKSKLLKKPNEWIMAWKQRKTHRFYTCPSCKTRIRIKKPPAGSKVKIRCPKCHKVFEKRI